MSLFNFSDDCSNPVTVLHSPQVLITPLTHHDYVVFFLSFFFWLFNAFVMNVIVALFSLTCAFWGSEWKMTGLLSALAIVFFFLPVIKEQLWKWVVCAMPLCFFFLGGGHNYYFFTRVDWRFWRKHNKATSKKRSGVILKKERKKKNPTGPAAQDMIVLMRRLLYLSFSSLPTV